MGLAVCIGWIRKNSNRQAGGAETRRFLYQISDDTKYQQSGKHHQKEYAAPRVGRGLPRSDIGKIGIGYTKQQDRGGQENDGIGVKRRNKIQPKQGDRHAGDPTARALQTRDGTERTGNPDLRHANENEVQKSNAENHRVSPCNPIKPLPHRINLGFPQPC